MIFFDSFGGETLPFRINAIFDVLQSVLISLKQVEWKMKFFFMVY